MYPLFESVCIENGQMKNGQYHELRFKTSYFQFYGCEPKFSLFDKLNLPQLDRCLKYKLRIDYKETDSTWTVSEYLNKIPTSLLLLKDDDIDYNLKYTDRKQLNQLYYKKVDFEDVLIVKNGHITDATYSNIIFTDGHKIVTPSTPLLHGTCRARLIAEEKITEAPIKVDTIHLFESFQLINALNDFNEDRWIRIQNIVNG
ncbi:aminotransferase class IV [uncultured Maribacter sp.]|uniref:aminotransferase class IV n=1 Tax=uncultured Maribacter sp. TaxID=431308 RepID=UPI0030EB4794|tara:strand:- start:55203 stop:55805 length:603 start_codon:yes stop_codon:yes gene_type:complete